MDQNCPREVRVSEGSSYRESTEQCIQVQGELLDASMTVTLSS